MKPHQGTKPKKSPKTNNDLQFLRLAREMMPLIDIKSDRAMSKALGQHESFISRINTGIQSVPSVAWDKLDELAVTHGLTTGNPGTSSRERAKGAIELEHTMADYIIEHHPGTVAEINSKLASASDCKKDLDAAHEKIALLTSQLVDKERTIQILMEHSLKKV